MQIADAAQIIGTSGLAIRRWLEKNQIPWLAHARPQKGEVAEFSDYDLLRMALVVVLINYGAKVAVAADVVAELLPPKVADRDIPKVLEVFPGEFDRIIFTHTEQKWSATMTNRRDEIIPISALVIHPGRLFEKVLASAQALRSRRAKAARNRRAA